MSANISDNPFYRCSCFAGKSAHLGICGSVACYKAADLLRAFLGLEIRVSATPSLGAQKFVSPLLFKALGANPVYGEMFASGDVFDHLEPGQIAQAMLIAPASANMLAKLAQGLADDMLSAQYLAFCGPVVIAPAMNPRMWRSPSTVDNVELLMSRGARVVEPGIGSTACGEEGRGKLAELPEIFLALLQALAPPDMRGLKVMVTLGPTRERWDSVRFWTNASSGRMGGALATAAWLRGADVTAICGPGINIFLPAQIRRVNVVGAKDMLEAAESAWPDMDIGLFCAAVADYAPEAHPEDRQWKAKKDKLGAQFDISFKANPDILATLSAKRACNQKVLGFAAEVAPDPASLLPFAQIKLERKGVDLIAANQINAGAFGAESGCMAVLDKTGAREVWDQKSKADIAWDLLTWLLKL